MASMMALQKVESILNRKSDYVPVTYDRLIDRLLDTLVWKLELHRNRDTLLHRYHHLT
ncbi:hypothetical protein [Methanothermobacter sp. DP]|uniref:hypothetical protein n=1 Tax=Methanothermobacter sp. DP TaxID=2998972 RepID=UPI002AA510B4|nr:hypothetical protein [Methanothermobacter sp. DP]